MDFKEYDDLNEMRGFDGFITPNGNFYKVKRKRGSLNASHEMWSEEYFKRNEIDLDKFKINNNFIFNLINLNSYTDKAIHLFGFVYYSHDPLKYKPIIKLPDYRISGKSVTPEQYDTLYGLLLINNENPDIPIFDGDTLTYVGLDDERKEDNYGEDKYSRFK